MDERDERGFVTKLTTPVGGELTEDELRSIEHYYSLDSGSLVKGIRVGQQDVTVTKRADPIHEIKIQCIVGV